MLCQIAFDGFIMAWLQYAKMRTIKVSLVGISTQLSSGKNDISVHCISVMCNCPMLHKKIHFASKCKVLTDPNLNDFVISN